MTPQDWKRVEGLFHQGLSLSEHEREQLIASASVEIAAQLRQLWQHAEPTKFMTSPLIRFKRPEAGDGQTSEDTTELSITQTGTPTQFIGKYRVLSLLGEGGMGTVYLGLQETPIARQVAIKVIKRGMDSREVLARFGAERQTLALMDHPCVAQIYDADITADGRPYFIMEYVQGVPITDYCDRNVLGCKDRLILFQQVCSAVHHAHQRGVIHRDIKPTNVLVTLKDGKPTPKIIDFGVAKAISQRLQEQAVFTELGMLIGTPEYMSPEQAESSADVDTTSDVYSLGVLLYELLTGALPFETKDLRKAGLAEIQRVIREDEPPRPTTRLSSLGLLALENAKKRRCDVPSLIRQLRGDLDWIVMKTLEKDRTRRYSSASEFAADIGRYLANEPVAAHAPEIRYLARKFVHRHLGLVAAGAAVALALLIGAMVSFTLYLRAVGEQQRAELESYSADLIAAEMQSRAGETEDAKVKLASTSPALRGWEWRHLMARIDQSTATIYVPEFSGPDIHIRSREMRFSADGAQLFSYGNSFLRSWDLATKRVMTDLSGLGRILALGPHGRTILVGPQLDFFADPPTEGFVLRIYDVSSRQVLSVLRGMTGNPGEGAISADGGMVAVPQDYQDIFNRNHSTPVMVWNAHTGDLIARLEGHSRGIGSLRFSPDGRILATGSWDETIRLWDLASRTATLILRQKSPVSAISFSRDGRLLASGNLSGTICIWDTGTGQLQTNWKTTTPGIVSAVEFSPDGRILATSAGSTIALWDVSTGRLVRDLGGHTPANALAFHPTAPRLYSAGFGVIKEWDLGERTLIDDANAPVEAIAVSPNGKWLVSGSKDGKMRIYDSVSANLLRTWDAHTEYISTIAFSPNSETVASGSLDKTIKMWRVPDGQLLRTMIGHTDAVWSIAFHPDGGRLLSSSADQTMRLWQTESDAQPVIIPTPDITRAGLSADGHTILALQRFDRALLLWNTETNRRSASLNSNTMEMSPAMLRSFALSPDGQLLVAPADTGYAIAIWDLPRRRLLRVLPVLRGENGVNAISISPDGSRVAVGATNSGTLSVWDLRQGHLLVTLNGHTQGLTSLAWSPDGTRLFSSSDDGTVRIWDSRSPYNHEAELLLDKLSERCMLVEEVVQELNADATVSPELRRQAMQLATQRGNQSSDELITSAAATGIAPNRPRPQYIQGLRRAYVATQVIPWHADSYTTLALLQYRTGDFGNALRSAARAINLQKIQSPTAHAIRAMAYYGLHDVARAKAELALGHEPHGEDVLLNAFELRAEAKSLILPKQAPRP